MCLSSTDEDVVATLQLFHVLLIVPHISKDFFLSFDISACATEEPQWDQPSQTAALTFFRKQKEAVTVFRTHAILLLTALLMTVEDVVLLH